MSTRTTKAVARVFAFLLVISVLSSCNRGSGCPNADFNMVPTFTMPFSK